jgi:hypothetical protein
MEIRREVVEGLLHESIKRKDVVDQEVLVVV